MEKNDVSRRNFLKLGTAGGLAALALDPRAARGGTQTLEENGPADGKVRLAVVQMETVPGAVERNRARALALASEALKNSPDIILFHEELLVGYVSNPKQLAEGTDGPTSRAFQSLLEGTRTLVLWGLTEREGDKCFIAANLVGASGVQANYRKTHLWWDARGFRYEPDFFEPGNKLVTFTLKGHKCGVMICYDGDFPEMTRCYANLGCAVLFWPNNRPSRGHKEVQPLANANSMVMPTACCCGKDELSHPCPGGSNITNYDGGLLAEIWDNEGVIYADVDPQEALEARPQNPLYRGRRTDLYARYHLCDG
jgi:predicted amidohydrolase